MPPANDVHNGEHKPMSSTVPNPIYITIIDPDNNGRYQATYSPPPGINGYQFPKETEQGIYDFQVVTEGFEIVQYAYKLKKGDKPFIMPVPGRIKATRNLRLDFVFGSATDTGDIEFKFHKEGREVEFDGDPQVGNDGQT